jgi:hypothetical protein
MKVHGSNALAYYLVMKLEMCHFLACRRDTLRPP